MFLHWPHPLGRVALSYFHSILACPHVHILDLDPGAQVPGPHVRKAFYHYFHFVNIFFSECTFNLFGVLSFRPNDDKVEHLK